MRPLLRCLLTGRDRISILADGPEHDGKVSSDHFGSGGGMSVATGGNSQTEARAAERQRAWDYARASHDDTAYVEQSHMGHEQADGKAGDTYAPGWKVSLPSVHF